MQRHYKDVESVDDVIYFVGPEIEHTKMFGEPTLFKVGDRPLDEILKYVKIGEEKLDRPINHIYFTANHSFSQISHWDIVVSLLDLGYYVTIDSFIYDLNEMNLSNDEKLIIIIALPISNAESKTNTYLKIDTETFGVGNPGVWITPLKNIIHFQDSENFTPWSDYKKDIILK